MKKYFIKAKKIYTFDHQKSIYDTLLIENNKISDLGNNLIPKDTDMPIIDLSDYTILPGFIDSHVHLTSTAINEILIDLSNFTSIKEIVKALEALRDSLPEGDWIVAKEFDPVNLEEKRNITQEELDKNFPKHPVLIIRKDSHSSIINSLGMKLLDVEIFPENGLIKERDHQIAIGKVYQNIDPSLLVKGLIKTLKKAAEKGITTIHALEGGYTSPPNSPQLLLGLSQYFPIDVIIYYQTTSIKKVKELGLRRIGGCLLVDGSISTLTAAVSEPYLPNQGYGVLFWDMETLSNFIRTAHKEDLQIAFHAVGDRGIDLLVRAYQKVLKEIPKEDHRHRIEHFELPNKEHIKLASQLNLTLSLQPSFLYFWGGEGKLYEQLLGKERAKRIIPLRSILKEEITAGGGSDSSVTPMDPFLGIYSAINHPNEEERITLEEAIKMFTYNGAYIGFIEKEKGSIERNKDADLVILEKNPFEFREKEEILNIKIVATISRGRFVYKDTNLVTNL
ncbi:MAG: amidohydrolase [Dictyoglomus sp.]|uniref:amidohydrolase n=1 Tax=Dictyoglomus sp. TaxID=28205 RepID=UPI003D10E0BB